MKKKMFFIVVSVLLMIGATIYMAINVQQNSLKSFTRAGYILNTTSASSNEKNTDDNETIKYYFSDNTSYKNSFDNNVEFKDTNGKKVKVSEASFIHYDDDSIGLLKKGVILNLEDINDKVPIYYNLFEGTILEYNGGTYYVDNLGKQLKFKQFIVRVSENKYLLVSDNIKLKLDDNTSTTIKSNYVEISVIEEGILKIENKDTSYQTVASDALIILGDLSLNLDNGYFFYKEEPIVNLNSMIIDSDDNVDITPIEDIREQIEKEKKEEEEKNKQEQEQEQNNNNGGSAGNGGGGASGGDTTTPEIDAGSSSYQQTETEVVENQLVLPSATVSDVSVSANEFQGTITINDPDSIVTGSTYTTIVENSNNRVVYERESDAGVYTLDVYCDTLSPETSYSLISNIHYMKNDIEYTMDVVQQLFVTSSIGISIDKDYYSATELAFKVKIDDYSKVKSADVKLINSSGEVEDVQQVTEENAKGGDGLSVLFGSLNPNTKYSVVVDNILYEDTIVADVYSIEISAKTLKTKPTMGTPSFSIDKKSGLFTLKLNNMVDSNNGVDKYIYEVYDARTLADNPQPITTIEKTSLTSVDLAIDNSSIKRAIPYTYKVTALFYDNEKYIEYSTGYSNNMQMDGVASPTIEWSVNEEAGGITFESINGYITISDPAGTIDYDKPMTVVYTNSIGTTYSYTVTSGNAIIPFNKNNLRANETYTISLYASVNLMDNNPAIDYYHVGSVIVKTKATNALDVLFNVDTDSVTEAFSIQAKLLNVNDADNTLEASTLSELTFLLYDGPNTSGTLVKRIRKVDSDEREYYSTLKDAYYDKSFTITPSFFNLNGSDLSSEYYTIVITDAKDYTDFKNDIPLINSEVTVQVNGFMDDPDPDSKEWFSTTLIRNKDAGTYGKHNDDLDANTIVGIKVTANFDNTKHYGTYLNYFVWDYTYGEDNIVEIENQRQTLTFKPDGSIDSAYYWFENGTPNTSQDNDGKLYRGHRYVFSFVGGLDLNKDGITDSRYPASEDKVLKSEGINIPKQAASISMYPASSTNTSITMKYTMSDVDNALVGSSLSANLYDSAGTLLNSNTQTIQNTSTFKDVTFTNFGNNGYLKIVADSMLIKNTDPTSSVYLDQYFDDKYTLPNISFTHTEAVNRILISIDNYDKLSEAISHIAALKITFTCEGNTIVKDFVKLNGDNAVVDMYDLSEFIGKPISISISAYYDNDLIGWVPSTDYVALQSVKDIYGGGDYITLNNTGGFVTSDIARGSIYSMTTASNKFRLSQMGTTYRYDMSMNIGNGGIKDNGTYYNLKQLATKNLTCSGNDTFTFYQIRPGISLENEDGVLDVSPAIQSVSFLAEVYGFGESNIRDSKIYAQLSYTDDVGSYITNTGDPYEFTLSQINSGVCEISGLTPGTYYALQFFAYVSDGQGGYTYTQLYDLDDNSENRIYYFRTLLSVGISDITATYRPVSYSEKNILITYSLDRIMGYDKIEYKLFKEVMDPATLQYYYEDTGINIEPDVGFKYSMTKTIPCPPGSDFDFGSVYKVEITPYVQSSLDGEWIALDETIGVHRFNLRTLRSPYVGVTATTFTGGTVTGSALEFKVTLYDTDQVVVGGKYSIELYELDSVGTEIPVTSIFSGNYYTTDVRRRTFIVDNLTEGKRYRLKIFYYLDINNTNSPVLNTYTYSTRALDPDSISVGTISAVANATNKSKIDLNFVNSNKITDIDYVRYIIYNSLDGTSYNNDIAFSPIPKTVSGTTIYYMTLPETLTSQGIYVVQLQFISDDKVVDEQEIDYSYF